MKPEQHVFLLATHILSDRILKAYHEIQQAVMEWGDTFLLYHQTGDAEIPSAFENINKHIFTDGILQELNYKPIKPGLIPGSNHFSLLHFYLANPGFTYYWYIEYDAVFNGSWRSFFGEFTYLTADLISSRIEIYKNMPQWDWWSSLQHPHKFIPLKDRVSSFNPVYRMSADALSFINEALLDKWSGHHEVLLATLLHNNDFRIMDFGGRGRFVPPRFQNKLYTWQTHRWRPVFTQTGPLKNKLYHPMK